MALSGTKAQEVTLGQYGSAFVNGTDLVQPPADRIICAITFMADTTLQAMQAYESDAGTRIFFNMSNAAHSSGTGSEGSGGDLVTINTIFPKGLTIYGRWKALMMASGDADGGMIVYFGPTH
mgnify:CR=1 FL=1|tara:strand:+ start:815 stop:1180 length:366 start_codon:yes stop_codon:yes gene_type:complete